MPVPTNNVMASGCQSVLKVWRNSAKLSGVMAVAVVTAVVVTTENLQRVLF